MKKIMKTLYINQPDMYLSLENETIVISQNGKKFQPIPLHNLEQIITFSHSAITPALIGKCAKSGISLVFMSRNGSFLARAEGETKGNVLLRREQYRIADNPEKSLAIAKNCICAKIFNSRSVLERMMRDHAPRIDCDKFSQKSIFLKEAVSKAENAPDMDTLRGIEGEAATVYFSVFDDMILQQKDDFYFHTRSRRPPLDRVNALLSFAYSVTTNMCVYNLEAVGLDPYVGFMHTDRPGRKSLALDMVEEFRSIICDRFVLTLINKRSIQPEHFDMKEDGAVYLSEQGRKIFFEYWEKQKYEELKHPDLNEKMQRGMLPYVQALLLARMIRGDLDCYPPFLYK